MTGLILTTAGTLKAVTRHPFVKFIGLIVSGVAVFVVLFAGAPGMMYHIEELSIRAGGGCQYYGHWFNRASPDWRAETPEIAHFGKENNCAPERDRTLFLHNFVPLPVDAETVWAEPDKPRVMKYVAQSLPFVWVLALVAVAYWFIRRFMEVSPLKPNRAVEVSRSGEE